MVLPWLKHFPLSSNITPALLPPLAQGFEVTFGDLWSDSVCGLPTRAFSVGVLRKRPARSILSSPAKRGDLPLRNFYWRSSVNSRARSGNRHDRSCHRERSVAICFWLSFNGDLRSKHVLGVDTGTISPVIASEAWRSAFG